VHRHQGEEPGDTLPERHGVELLGQLLHRRERLLVEVLQHIGDDVHEHVFLVPEVQVERAVGGVGALGDGRHGGAAVAPVGERGPGRGQQEATGLLGAGLSVGLDHLVLLATQAGAP
jgi:hypothetical protein